MKIFVLLLSLTLIVMGCDKDVDKDQVVDYGLLIVRDGLVYLKEQPGSFSGIAETRYENGQLKISAPFKDGRKDGLVKA